FDARAAPMKLVPFEMERWQSTWEHSVKFNLSESGVEPLPLRELLRDDASVEHFLNHPLAYSQGNGTPELRSSIAAMYRGATPEQVLVTNGSSEACLLALWHLVEPGDEVVLMLPNYMESWGLVQMFGGKAGPPDRLGRRASGYDRDAVGLPRLHEPDADLSLRPSRPDRALPGPTGGNPRPDAFHPAAELRHVARMDRCPRIHVHAHPSDRGSDLLPAVLASDQFLGPRLAAAEGEVDADRTGGPVRHGRLHPDRHGPRRDLPVRSARPRR